MDEARRVDAALGKSVNEQGRGCRKSQRPRPVKSDQHAIARMAIR
jgi:hypothetical protein